MAKFKLGDDAEKIKKVSAGGITILTETEVRVQGISVDAKSDGHDFLGDLNRMAAGAREAKSGTGVILEELPDASVFASADIRVSRLLQEVHALIKNKKYAEALDRLREVRKEQPGNPEAAYLAALCHFNLGKPEEALRELLPLRDHNIDSRLDALASVLRGDIRHVMRPLIILEHVVLLGAGQYNRVVSRINDLLALDPDCGFYHYLMAGTLLLQERCDEALKSAEAGLEVADREEMNLITHLKGAIVLRKARTQMVPARREYREGKYRKARDELARLDGVCRTTPLWKTFDRYLADLGETGFLFWRHRKDPAQIRLHGSFQDIDALHGFLVEEEIQEARKCMAKDDYASAERSVTAALRYTPQYPFAHFLCAYCQYRHLGDDLGGKKIPPLDDVERRLETARRNAEFGATDDEIRDAPKLLKVLEQNLKEIGEVRRHRSAMEKEAGRLNEAIEEFQAIMESVKKGISSPGQFREIYNRMEALQGRIPVLRRALTNDQCREVLQHLEEAIDRNMEQLRKMQSKVADSEVVEKVFNHFKNRMDYLQEHKISNYQELQIAKSFFTALASQVVGAKREVGDSEAKDALDHLARQVRAILDQLESH